MDARADRCNRGRSPYVASPAADSLTVARCFRIRVAVDGPVPYSRAPGRACHPMACMTILTVDVGGQHVKALATGQTAPRRMNSGRHLTAAAMVQGVKDMTADWTYDVTSLGYPGQVVHNIPAHEPVNLGRGWTGFDYGAAFGCPVRIINDAAMQALGSYEGQRMLFLGLGTGLGSAMIIDGHLAPMELGHLPYKKGKTYEDYVGERGLKWRGGIAGRNRAVHRWYGPVRPADPRQCLPTHRTTTDCVGRFRHLVDGGSVAGGTLTGGFQSRADPDRFTGRALRPVHDHRPW